MVSDSNTKISTLRDQLSGRLIGLARAVDGSEHLISEELTQLIVEGLATLASASVDSAALEALIGRTEAQKRQIVPNCFTCAMPCGRTEDYDLQKLWHAHADSRSLRSLILFGICDIAAHVRATGCQDAGIHKFLYQALFTIGRDDWDAQTLMPVVLELGSRKLQCMGLDS